jgi:hypothetical protein
MRRLPFHLFLVLAVVAGYLIWIAASRQSAGRVSTQVRLHSPDIPKEYLPDGPGVKIVSFYTGTREISRGESATICYSVVNAKAVRVEPPVEELKPSINRCFAASPERTTAYTLYADGQDGSAATASFAIQVNPPPPRIEMLTISAKAIRRGQPFDMCYSTKNATAMRLEPPVAPVAPTEKRCFRWFPLRTTKYVLTAVGDAGRKDTLRFTVAVN